MSIPDLTYEDVSRILNEHLTPSASIKTPERLFGRGKNLTSIERALNSSGRQIFIHGDRGVGKTSLAQTAAALHCHSSQDPIYVVCGRTSTFGDVIEDIARNATPLEGRYIKSKENREFNLSILGSGIGYNEGTRLSNIIDKPKTINDALEVIRFVSSRFREPLVIVIDELERIESPDEREKFGELIKNVPELGDKIRFIFCGISNDINELLSYHPSAGRILETIKLDRLNHNDLWAIILGVAEKLGVNVDNETLVRISQISDGFPHFVHLIGESMFWNMWDDDAAVSRTRPCDFKAGVLGALKRTEEVHRAAYDRATMKTKNTQQYEMALWALADRTSDKRQLSEIYESSLKRLQYNQSSDFPFMTREILNQRLLALRKESHARISIGFGSGWFGVREKIMRGYIRLRAEQEGVQLGLDQS